MSEEEVLSSWQPEVDQEGWPLALPYLSQFSSGSFTVRKDPEEDRWIA